MPSVVEICNLALAHIGGARIQALTDNSAGANACALIYEPLRDSALRDFPWNFAESRQVLALMDETASGWNYVYQFPSDCIRALHIYNPISGNSVEEGYYRDGQFYHDTARAGTDKIDFQVALNAAKNSRVILTNKESAELVYTARVSDPNLFDPLFVRALSYAMAADMAVPLKGSAQLKDQLLRDYIRIVSKAQVSNANEFHKIPNHISKYVPVRG